MRDRTAKSMKSQDSDYHRPSTVEEITKQNVETIARLEQATNAERAQSDRLADAIANFCGSMPFVWAHVIWFTGWVIINVAPGISHFDPFPFNFLTLIVSLEAIFLSTFILISQNHETRLSDRRNQLDLQVNLLSEQENTKMLTMLERIAKKVGVRTDDDPSVQVLEQSTRPEKLIDQIDQAKQTSARSSPKAGYN